ncbi:MAG: N,N-dimethylformamidase beta subunit family domain-containing protein, partial [Betaproteobacteria bacterium]
MNDLPKLTIVGYADRQSVAPGDAIKFMVSEEGNPNPYRARLFRMHSMDSHAGGCGLIEEEIQASFTGEYAARHQDLTTGSYVRFPKDLQPQRVGSFTAQAYIWPTLPATSRQTLIAYWNGHQGFRLEIDEAGALSLSLTGVDGVSQSVTTGMALLAREWYFVSASYDLSSGRILLTQKPLRPYPVLNESASAEGRFEMPDTWSNGVLSIAAHALDSVEGTYAGFFNGKIDRPRLTSREMSPIEIQALAEARVPIHLARETIGFWDFSLEQNSTMVRDLSHSMRHGEVVNLPSRAMTGFNWTGGNNDFNVVPDEYGAIHFHDDDLYDAKWDADFEWTVPDDLPSGCYAVKLDNGDLPGYIVFFVR